MSEILTDLPQGSTYVESNVRSDVPQTFSERLRRNAREAGQSVYSLLDLSAGIALTSTDIVSTQEMRGQLNHRYDGLLERQVTDSIPMALEADILLTFRRDAQRAGYTDADSMPADLRAGIVEGSVHAHAAEIINHLQTRHPDWTAEELKEAAEQRIADCVKLLNMDGNQRDTYRAAMFEYMQLSDKLPDMQEQLDTLRQQRRERVARIGRTVVQAVVNAPYALKARATVMRMSVGNWYANRSVEGKRAIRYTAAGLAIGALATYVTWRLQGGEHHPSYTLVGDNTSSVDIDQAGGLPDHAGLPVVDALPDQAGTSLPDHAGASLPDHASGSMPDHAGGNLPDSAGGGDLSGIHTSHELFTGIGKVDEWPDTITVSRWDPSNHDGSVWGISEQMLHRAGFDHPSTAQIDQLADALRPQAQPNGYLLAGQQLHLQPAVDVLQQLG